METYSSEIVEHLTPIIIQMGGLGVLNSLPEDIVRELMTHPDEVVIVKQDNLLVAMPGRLGSYRVLDAEMHVQYEVTSPTFDFWGGEVIDAAFFLDLPYRSYFYLAFNQEDLREPDGVISRLILVLKV